METQISWYDIPTDFMVERCTSVSQLRKYINSPYKVKAGIFIFCMDGYIQTAINASECTIKPLDMVTILPNSFIQLHEVSPDIQLYFAIFSSNFMGHINFIKTSKNCLPLIYKHPIISVSQKTANLFRNFYDILFHSIKYPNLVNNKEIIKSVFTIFAQSLVELYTKNENLEEYELTRNNEIYQDFLYLAMTYYTTRHDVTFYADQLGLTLSYLSTTIKKTVGKTPSEIIAQIIISDAKSQLKGSDSGIKEIAIDLGFNNLSFFNKFFRQHVGISPLEYRGKAYTY
ncbi:helix-turn-helix domain-containing protein [Parabacteroides bouchesdurhonensis]|uniref:helix-turn-helix domain-containing protein n=2 Tax=Parabacteroides bouchesdurhonensis TaxID=1936995 RepID=UPI000C865710|nr:helix-turn-helix domain-containing protein [Parabacteroides bouchesdurhonensis]